MKSSDKTKFRSKKVWKNFRTNLLKARDFTCEISGFRRKKGLNIHHHDEENYEDLTEAKFSVLTSAEHDLIERLLKRKDFDIDLYLYNLKKVYLKSKYYKDGNK